MKKTGSVRAVLLGVVLLCVMALFVSCGGDGDSSKETTPAVTTQPSVVLTKLTAPVVVLTDDIAAWSADTSADKFEISVNGELSYIENTVTSKTLTDGQTFKIRAIGDGIQYESSDWSNSVTYTEGTIIKENYTVTFCDWDGTVLYEQTVSHGAAATFPEGELERDGYRFDGWDKSFNNITQDLIVTAQYVAVVEIQFLDYDGSVIYFEYIDQGTNFTNVPSDPVRQDYKFTGWSTTAFTNIAENLTVYAQYVRTYRVAFVDYDGSLLKSERIMEGTAATAPANPVREGYGFVGWDRNFEKITSDLTVTAIYQYNRYTVTFVGADGAVISVQRNIRHGYSATAPEVSDMYFHLGVTDDRYTFGKGYRFTEWSQPFQNVTFDLTVEAVYGTEITDSIIAAAKKNVIKSQGLETEVVVYIINGNAPCGISLDLQISPTLLKGGAPTIKVNGEQVNSENEPVEYYESKLNNEGYYEYRWTRNNGITNNTVVTFTFKINISEDEGEYPIDILDSTYIITNDLTKVTPVLIDGSVIVQN